MKYQVVFIVVLCLFISTQAQAISESAKKKYPYQLLTADYGILNENDLAAYTWKITHQMPAFSKGSLGINYWQCFARNQVSVTLEDTGGYSEDFPLNTTIADLTINVRDQSGITHEYGMRSVYDLPTYQRDFNRWQKLMKGEKYVCLGGDFVSVQNEFAPNGEKIKVYGWIFDKLKTKKGCASYFEGDCDLTYAKYKQREVDFQKLMKELRSR